MKNTMQNCKPDPTKKWQHQAVNMNRRVVYAATEVGFGHAAINNMCSILNIESTVASSAWNDHLKVLFDVSKQVLHRHLEEARNRARVRVLEQNPDLDPTLPVDIAGSFDGTGQNEGLQLYME